MRCLIASFALLTAVHAAELTVKLEPMWGNKPLLLDDVSLTNSAQNKLSLTRLAMLLSHAQLQRHNGQWIGAQDWVAFVDVAKNRLSFSLNGIPEERFTAFRFDLGLDEAMDKADAGKWPANHPLNPAVNALHWSWRGQYVFLALEGRYQQADAQLGGYSYHLAGQSCRGTVEFPIELDLRSDLVLTLSVHADRIFSAQHRIDITAADSTHSGEDGGLAGRIADNAVQAFGILRVEPSLAPKQVEKGNEEWKPKLLAHRLPAHFPATEFPKDNLLTEQGVELGRRLFHDARLSINNTQSCASCHLANSAFSDPRRFSLGAEGQVGKRQAMPLFNLAWKPAFFWDGRAKTLREQVLMPIQDKHEMNETLERVVAKIQGAECLVRSAQSSVMSGVDQRTPSKLSTKHLALNTPATTTDFEAAFGTPEITADRIARALEQFLLTLISGDSAMDQTLTKGRALTEQEQRGFQLFFTESDPARGIQGADCFHCHGGAHFTNHQFLNNGLDDDTTLKDEGLARVTGKHTDKGKFIVPSLRNIALTAPYMHDGRFTTLEEVIDHYDHGLKRSPTLDPNLAKHLRYNGLQLTKEDKAALVAFLKTLTDEEFGKIGAK